MICQTLPKTLCMAVKATTNKLIWTVLKSVAARLQKKRVHAGTLKRLECKAVFLLLTVLI